MQRASSFKFIGFIVLCALHVIMPCMQAATCESEIKPIELYSLAPVLLEKTPLPAVIVSLVIEYHTKAIAGERIPVISARHYLWQRANNGLDELTVFGAEQTFQFPLITDNSLSHCSEGMPENPCCSQKTFTKHWDMNTIESQLREFYHTHDSELHMHDLTIEQSNNPLLPRLAGASISRLGWLAEYKVILKKRTDSEVAEAQAISTFDTMNNMDVYLAMQLVKNVVIGTQQQASQFPDQRFPKEAARSEELNKILDGYKRHKGVIETFLNDTSRSSILIFYQGGTFEECIEHARKRRKNDYKIDEAHSAGLLADDILH